MINYGLFYFEYVKEGFKKEIRRGIACAQRDSFTTEWPLHSGLNKHFCSWLLGISLYLILQPSEMFQRSTKTHLSFPKKMLFSTLSVHPLARVDICSGRKYVSIFEGVEAIHTLSLCFSLVLLLLLPGCLEAHLSVVKTKANNHNSAPVYFTFKLGTNPCDTLSWRMITATCSPSLSISSNQRLIEGAGAGLEIPNGAVSLAKWVSWYSTLSRSCVVSKTERAAPRPSDAILKGIRPGKGRIRSFSLPRSSVRGHFPGCVLLSPTLKSHKTSYRKYKALNTRATKVEILKNET